MTNQIRAVLLSATLIVSAACAGQSGPQQPRPGGTDAAPLRYTVNMTDTAAHKFAVTLRVDSLASQSDIFEFASTAPGTYQVMDIGRFVSNFEAFDGAGTALPVERISTNQWKISNPRQVREIRYRVIGTRDTTVQQHPVYAMCGTTLKFDYAQINGQAVFGFPRGMQAAPLTVRLEHPAGWTVGTALVPQNGTYRADNYDHLVDSPFLLGSTLTTAQLNVTGVPVEIFVHSAKGLIQASQLRDAMSGMLSAAGAFLGKLPVDRYTFLFDFGPTGAGAWEHSYSSGYVLSDIALTPQYGQAIKDIAAHEFFHIVTPLNIHSEIIEHFNFETPVPSQHLWLYEGTTEWAAHKMQLEFKLKTPEQYLANVVTKVKFDRTAFDTTYSLTKLAMTSFTDAGQRQYGNIYQRGAVVAGLFDILLLEQSNGEHGLQDLVNDLAKKYGKQRAFPEATFFDELGKRLGAPAADFMRRYIQESERPPVKEFYAKLGINLIEDDKGLPVRFEMMPNPTPTQLRLRKAWLGQWANALPAAA